MINSTGEAASFNLDSVTHADFKMTPWMKKNRFTKSILAVLGGAAWLRALATTVVAQTAMIPSALPLYFEASRVQADSTAQFIARGRDSQFLISPNAAQFV